ncbi:hypothetical protein GIB67_032107 [Kingdonia uniflora]|uniref:Uncharacterized protein n=1 Tax=Kingdonia uniflora TaxID=39325 RepID=A0A7J7MWT3_9MAGN|nr:hypothetical protein GIB67_032107 [Kingdonia uniflora]
MYSIPDLKWNSFPSSAELLLTAEFKNGTDVIWQIPISPKAVIFLAHGCNGRVVKFWDRSSSCLNCADLPKERVIILHALSQKFTVLTISSGGRCWPSGEERLLVKDIIKWCVGKNKLEQLPLMALGASSGGYFLSKLVTDIIFNGVTLMITEGVFGKMNVPDSYPPAHFEHMPKDRTRMRLISKNMEALRQKGIHDGVIKC